MGSRALLFFLLTGILSSALAGRVLVDQTAYPDKPIVVKYAMFNKHDAPAKTWPGSGQSTITLDFSVTNPGNSKVYIATVMVDYLKHFGFEADNGDEVYCCTEAYISSADKSRCALPIGSLAVSRSEGDSIFIDEFMNNTIKTTHNVTETGMYYTFFINCPVDATPNNVVIQGKFYFMNPFGNLSGDLWYYMPFFLSLLIVYLLIWIYWIGISLKYRKQLLTLQNWINLVIFCGVIENASIYFAYLGYNNIGQNYIGAMIVGTIVSSLKKTLSRVLILVVCMGYGVVKPTLGTTSYRVAMLGLLYFIFSCASFISELVQRSGSVTVSDAMMLLLVLPTAFLNTWFYWWTITSLTRTITLLQERRQTIKLAMYKSFFITLLALGCALIIIVFSQTIVMLTTREENTWKIGWIWDFLFEVLYLVILLTIVIVWRPMENNTRYAYSEMDSTGNDDVESDMQQVVLSTFSPSVSHRKPTPQEGETKRTEGDESKASFTIDEE